MNPKIERIMITQPTILNIDKLASYPPHKNTTPNIKNIESAINPFTSISIHPYPISKDNINILWDASTGSFDTPMKDFCGGIPPFHLIGKKIMFGKDLGGSGIEYSSSFQFFASLNPLGRQDGSEVLDCVASHFFLLSSLPSLYRDGTEERGLFWHWSMDILFFASVPSPPLPIYGDN